ncbi:MAG TPA: DNA polymerase III subunit delta [Isosphaeraceae bacterium]
MHAFELLKDPAQAAKAWFCAVHGDDVFLRRESIAALVRGLLGDEPDDLAVTRFLGDKATLSDVLDELRTLPLLVGRRVVIVDDADPFVTAHRKELEGLADGHATPGALILVAKTWPSNTRLAKAVNKVGLAIDCKSPAERELPTWLVQVARVRSSVKLHPAAAQLLVELVGPEIGLLVSEVEKLAVSVGEKREIKREDVASMVGAGRVDRIWDALDAATTGHGGKALAELDKLMASGEHPVGLLAAMGSSLRKVHHAGQLRRAKRDLVTACKEAGAYNAAQVGAQHTHLGPKRVDGLPGLLLQADLDLKGSTSLTPEVVLERLVVRLARERED